MVISVAVRAHAVLSYLKLVSWQIGFRNQKFSSVEVAIQIISIANETYFLRPVNECEYEVWV